MKSLHGFIDIHFNLHRNRPSGEFGHRTPMLNQVNS